MNGIEKFWNYSQASPGFINYLRTSEEYFTRKIRRKIDSIYSEDVGELRIKERFSENAAGFVDQSIR